MNFQPCVVVPVFNHGAGAAALAAKLEPLGLRTFLIDDGSDEATRTGLQTLARQCDWIEVIGHAENKGKGAAVLTGLRAALAAGYTHAVQIDSDGQHNADDVPQFLRMAEANPQAVIAGCPEFDSSIPRGRLVARYLTHFWVWIETLSFKIQDSMCGFRVYPLEPVIALSDRVRLGRRMDFDPEVLVRLLWEGVDILSRPTRVTYPVDGQSHFRLWHDNYLISWMHTRLVVGMVWRVLRGQFGKPVLMRRG